MMTERQRAKRDGRCRIDMQRAKHNGDGCVICRSTITSTPDWTAPAALVLVLALPCARPTRCASAAASALHMTVPKKATISRAKRSDCMRVLGAGSMFGSAFDAEISARTAFADRVLLIGKVIRIEPLDRD